MAARDVRALAAEKLVVHEQTGRACIEQYRRVAAMLHQLQEERGTKVLMVASAQPGEGKTLTAANLALTLSESYRRSVLLIDADLRRPSLNALFRLNSASGLSDRLKGNGQGPLRVLELSDRLALLPGGSPDTDPMAGLTSGRMQQIIEQASQNYDWIILDTPPVALQPDATLLAGMVEATIFVIGAGKTRSAVIQHAIETIGREKIVGVVLNRIDDGELDEAAYYHYYYNREPIRPRAAQLSGL
jgi:capsular exopolysaccharide synthesis family protein